MHSSTQAQFGLLSCVFVCNLKWLLTLYAKNTHSLKVCRCSRYCFHCPYLLAGRMLKQHVAYVITHIAWVIAVLRAEVSLQHCQHAAGLSSSKACSLHVNATAWSYKPCTIIEFVENLQSVTLLPLFPPPADICFWDTQFLFLFSCSLKKKF